MSINRRDFLNGACALSLAPGGLLLSRAAPATAGEAAELVAAPAELDLLGEPGRKTPVWAYNGSVPGPVIRARKGERVKARLINRIDQPTSVHWHGIRIDNAMDGVVGLTQDAVAPGDTFDYDFVVPDAGTYWYHSHNRSWEQVARGLYGLLVVEEETDPGFDRDIPLVLDDWRLSEDGPIHEASFGAMHDWSHAGRLGNWLTVNSRSRPGISVAEGEHVRLRLLNAANARVLRVGFGELAPAVIAVDGLAVQPRPLTGALVIAPGQRVDLALEGRPAPNGKWAIFEVSAAEPFEFASISVSPAATPLKPRPGPLLPIPDRPRLDLGSALRQDLLMEGGAMGGMAGAMVDGRHRSMRELVGMGLVWSFNGVAGETTEPWFSVETGRTVVIDMINDTAFPHAMHLHGQHFKVVERQGRAVDGDWRDTELVEADERVAVAFVADNPGKWLFHCHMLEHQAAGMRTWINVGE